MKEIDPPAEAESVNVDLAMDPGQKILVSIVDPDGRPLSGVTVDGVTPHGYQATFDEPTAEVANLSPAEERTVVFRHEKRKLGLVARIKTEQAGDQPITVKLQPIGTVIGRLLNAEGIPVAGAKIEPCILPGGDFGKRLPR